LEGSLCPETPSPLEALAAATEFWAFPGKVYPLPSSGVVFSLGSAKFVEATRFDVVVQKIARKDSNAPAIP